MRTCSRLSRFLSVVGWGSPGITLTYPVVFLTSDIQARCRRIHEGTAYGSSHSD